MSQPDDRVASTRGETRPPLERLLDRGGPAMWGTGAAVALAVIGVTDSLTDPNVTFALFYLIPVALAAWCCARWTAFVVALACATTWLAVDFAKGRFQVTTLAYTWNFSSRLIFLLAFAALLAALHRASERERASARKDFLTDTFNGRAFYELAEREIVRASRYGRPLTLVYIDVDNFKTINDTRGHHEGDQLLRAIAAVMNTSTRATDVVSRLGGDEFVILLSETGMETARAVVSKLQGRLMETVRANGWPVTFSLGVLVCGETSAPVSRLIARADQLMYAVKRQSKDGIRFQEEERVW